MKRVKNITPVLVFIMLSCSGNESKIPPKNLIPTEKIISLIVDLTILENHYQRKFSRPDLYKNALDSSSQFVFTKYNTTKSDFDSSFGFYAQNTSAIYSIYEAALDSINFRLSAPE